MQYSSGALSLAAFVAAASLVGRTTAHSWIEEVRNIGPNGAMTGDSGFARNFVARGAPGFRGDETDSFNKILTLGPSTPVCLAKQQTQTQSNGFPRLQTTPGSMVALRYVENGHVSNPRTPIKPPNTGSVYIYGTTQPQSNELYSTVRTWTADGSGGDKRGKLLAIQNFDDGRCYQRGSLQLTARQSQYSFPASVTPMTKSNTNDLPCQNDIQIPKDAPTGKPYTLYWIWDWSDVANVNTPNKEIYTSCLDVDIKAGSPSMQQKDIARPVSYDNSQTIIYAAIPTLLSGLASGLPSQSVAPKAAVTLSPSNVPSKPLVAPLPGTQTTTTFAAAMSHSSKPLVTALPSTATPLPLSMWVSLSFSFVSLSSSAPGPINSAPNTDRGYYPEPANPSKHRFIPSSTNAFNSPDSVISVGGGMQSGGSAKQVVTLRTTIQLPATTITPAPVTITVTRDGPQATAAAATSTATKSIFHGAKRAENRSEYVAGHLMEVNKKLRHSAKFRLA